MTMTKLSCDTLGDIHEGRARLMIRDLLKTVYEDLELRGHDGKTRTLNLKVTFTPLDEEVEFDIEGSVKLPPNRTAATRGVLKLTRGPEGTERGLHFRDDSDSVDQPTLDDAQK